jgi:DNA (cytosine-5)-methyltransferase 1
MTKQLDLLNTQDKKKPWSSSLRKAFNFSRTSGWPDVFSQQLRKWSKDNKIAINTLSLFSGGGGLDIGFHDAGFKIKEMVEIEEKYVKTLLHNNKNWFDDSKINCVDIREYKPENLKVDFIIGGPPCQTFSAAGRRAKGVMGIDDPRGNLFKEYVRLLQTLKPKGFLFENVYALIGAQKGKPWKLILEGFDSVGYKVHYKVLDAADYGVPQHRERIIIVGIRKDLNKSFKFPYPLCGPDSTEEEPHYSAKEAIGGVRLDEKIKPVNGKYGHLLDGIPPGLNYSFYTDKMGHPNPVFGWRSKFSDFLYKADPNKPVRAIKAQGGQYTGPFSWENRFFHLSELKRLQTFPDNYEIVGSRNVVVEQIGNSVPPQFARILALSVLDQIFDVKLPLNIPYMEDSIQLGFRTRTRELTKEYEQKAREAIKLMVKSDGPKSRRIPQTKDIRYLLLNKMKWLKKKVDDATEIIVKHAEKEGDVWEITASNKNIENKKITYSILVKPKIGWKLPYEHVELVALSPDEVVFTALWKSFEEKVAELYGYADLVQLFGYYQYESNLRTKFEPKNIEVNGFWKLVDFVLNSGIPKDAIQLEDLADILRVDKNEVFDYLVKAKELGYEIRNNSTNPQIEDGHFLIPYGYPTLSHRSVQLSKGLI